MQDTCYSCKHCGRKIVAHNLGELNLLRHEESCIGQEKKKKSRRYQRAVRKAAAAARSVGVGSTVVPGPGQLGFPFEGIEEEIVE